MKIRLTEVNAWERERWTYILDSDVIGGQVINLLMIFVRLNNQQFDKIRETNKSLFAGSRYFLEFYDSMEKSEKLITLINGKKNRLNCSRFGGNYKSGGDYSETKISIQKMKKAVNEILYNENNILYKNFEYLFKKR